MAYWLPEETLQRKKIGFATPVDGWLRSDLATEVRERLLAPGSACSAYFVPGVIGEMLDAHRSGRQDYRRALFAMLTFELWHERFIAPARWATTEALPG